MHKQSLVCVQRCLVREGDAIRSGQNERGRWNSRVGDPLDCINPEGQNGSSLT